MIRTVWVGRMAFQGNDTEIAAALLRYFGKEERQ